jgi:NAD(P)H-hydrate epimerase
VNVLPIRLRAAIDLPSGLGDSSAFRADFTYATGIVKAPVLALPNAGRVRYLDLGFFQSPPPAVRHLLGAKLNRVLASATLDSLRALRPSQSDKRTYGHLFVIGGSRHYPGAVLMSVLAALRSGAGLVTAFVPESLASAFAARLPEAMWVGWPETPEGGLALEGTHLLREKITRATALLIGPGLGREPETLALAKDIVGQSAVPLVIDADALQSQIVAAGKAPRVLTPHAGEYARIEHALPEAAVTVRKGPVTQVNSGGVVYHSFYGGPVLARGGSGDLLAGLIGGLLAQTSSDLLGAAARGVVWHGLAADELARTHGQIAVTTTQLLEFLPRALRG